MLTTAYLRRSSSSTLWCSTGRTYFPHVFTVPFSSSCSGLHRHIDECVHRARRCEWEPYFRDDCLTGFETWDEPKMARSFCGSSRSGTRLSSNSVDRSQAAYLYCHPHLTVRGFCTNVLHTDRLITRRKGLEEPGGDHIKSLQLRRYFLDRRFLDCSLTNTSPLPGVRLLASSKGISESPTPPSVFAPRELSSTPIEIAVRAQRPRLAEQNEKDCYPLRGTHSKTFAMGYYTPRHSRNPQSFLQRLNLTLDYSRPMRVWS